MNNRLPYQLAKYVFIAMVATGLSRAAPAGADTTVYAAASLKNALDEAVQRYRRESGHNVVVSYAASSALAKQIENGAPADMFISADLAWMDYLQQRNLIQTKTRANLLANKLVLIAPAKSTVKADIKPGFPLSSLLGKGRLAMADPDYVPAGKYGKAALQKLGVWQSVEKRIARGENVRTALNFVSRGEAPLGIVYQTDAYIDKNVRIVGQFPEDTHPPIVYPVALTTHAKTDSEASRLLEFVKSSVARQIFERYGFAAGQ